MWYYVSNQQSLGPVGEDEMHSLIANATVVRQTMVWKEGMTDWTKASETELNALFAGVPSAPPSYAGPARYPGASADYTPESFRKLWLWFAWLTGVGLPLCFLIVGIAPVIAGSVISYILLYRFWSLIQDGHARTSPGKAVGFCFIPFFNFYWLYVAFVGLSQDMNRYCEERQIAGPRVNEGLALTFYILFFCTMIPYAGIAVSVAMVVIQIILMKQFTEVAIRLLESRNSNGNRS